MKVGTGQELGSQGLCRETADGSYYEEQAGLPPVGVDREKK